MLLALVVHARPSPIGTFLTVRHNATLLILVGINLGIKMRALQTALVHVSQAIATAAITLSGVSFLQVRPYAVLWLSECRDPT